MLSYVVSCCSRYKSAERQEYESLRDQLQRKQAEVRMLEAQMAQIAEQRNSSGEDLSQLDNEPDPNALWLPGTKDEPQEGAAEK